MELNAQQESRFQMLAETKFAPNVEGKTSCFGKMMFSWTHHLISKGAELFYNKQQYMKINDLFDVLDKEHPQFWYKMVRENYFQANASASQGGNAAPERVAQESEQPTPIDENQMAPIITLYQFLKTYSGRDFVIGGIVGPIFMNLILLYIEDPTAAQWKGWLWASIMFVAYLLRAILNQLGLVKVYYNGSAVTNVINLSLMEKILTLGTSSKKYFDHGRIMNYVTVDTQQIFQMNQFANYLFSSPAVIVVAMILIIVEIGWIGVFTPIFFIIALFFQRNYTGYILMLRNNLMLLKDKRSKHISEFFSGIRVIKYYGWEGYVTKRVSDVRVQETGLIYGTNIVRALIDTIGNSTPLLICVFLFSVYIALGNQLSASLVYSVLSYFNLLIIPLRMMLFATMLLLGAKTSMIRIQHFMECEQRDPQNVIEVSDDKILPRGGIRISGDAEFCWENISSAVHNKRGEEFQRTLMRGPPNSAKNSQTQTEDGKAKPDIVEELKKKDLRILRDINFEAQPGELIAVVGQVASGKTSILHALLGEMVKTKGLVQRNGSVAYVPQTAWLQNTTLRDNVLFCKPFEEDFYRTVIKNCELEADIDILPGRDLTEIGEKGVNLSGGQKQRVSIARALYQMADIYIIDDCLSALDAHVGKNVFNNVLNGMLKGKTRIFVTHALQFMPQVDKIAVVKDGRIVEFGTYAQLSSKSGSEFNGLSVQMSKKQKEEEEQKEAIKNQKNAQSDLDQLLKVNKEGAEQKASSNPSAAEPLLAAKVIVENKQDTDKQLQKKGAMVLTEERATGAVPMSVYTNYIQSGGFWSTFATVFAFIMAQACRMIADWWVGRWAVLEYSISNGYYILIYALLVVTVACFFYLRGLTFTKFAIKSANKYLFRLLEVLLHTPMSWFDTTPSGRIVARVTKDQDDIDLQLPFTMQSMLVNCLQLIGSVIMIVIILPYFLAVAAVAIYIYYRVFNYYMITAREVKRIESVQRAPVISSLQEMIHGTYVIRAFGRSQFFVQKFLQTQHNYIVAYVNMNAGSHWIGIVTDVFAAIMIAGTAYFGVLSKTANYVQDAGLIGLALTYSFQIASLISFTLRNVADTENTMNAFIRMGQYIDHNPQEKPFEEPKKEDSWPASGTYDLKGLTYRYREGLPNVIHGISLQIANAEKIGVVGRTGSGKSTLTLGLLRILELIPDENGHIGQIILDKQNIADVGLHVLRKRCTIIPQDPVLFSGTIRENIDPFVQYKDEEIVEVLRKVQLWEQLGLKAANAKDDKKKKEVAGQQGPAPAGAAIVLDMVPAQVLSEADEIKKRIDFTVEDGGSNFSLGQRQLICVARALIKKPKVLLMDEATASIDEMTDHIIQKMIKEEFKQITVITIAHRINTIIQYDRIVILDNGKIVDIDTPLNLMDKKDGIIILLCQFTIGIFAKLIGEHGEDFKKKMVYLASNKDKNLDQISQL